MGVPSLACESDSVIVPSSSSSNFLDRFSTPVSDDDSEDDVYEGLYILVCIMFKLFISALYACLMFMGLFACMFGVSSILFDGQRVGDVTNQRRSKS